MAQPRRIVVPVLPVAPRRIATEVSPQRSADTERKCVPWVTIAVLLLAVVVIFALWGKLPKRPRMPHQTPSGNVPGASRLFSPDRFTRA
jgi:hypothetical protein